MNLALWILQGLLAAVFLWHGWLFVSPPGELVAALNAQFAVGFRVFLGVAELLGALGLILPGLIRRLPWGTPLAAAGLALVTASATVFHLLRGEVQTAPVPAILCVLLGVVAALRWKRVPVRAGRTVGTLS
jgi:DoxX-like family